MKPHTEHLFSPENLTIRFENSHLLFDTVAVDQLIHFEAYGVMKKLFESGAKFCYIHQVLLELMATDNAQKRIERQLFLSKYNFQKITHIDEVIRQFSMDLQELLHKLDCHPSPTDLYLGASLNSFTTINKTYLVTGDAKDFPSPVYQKIGFIILSSNKHVRTLTVLGMKPIKVKIEK